MTKNAAPKTPGKCATLHAMWNDACDGQLLPRKFAVDMAVAAGANPSTARTQAQRWLSTFQQREQMAGLVGESAH